MKTRREPFNGYRVAAMWSWEVPFAMCWIHVNRRRCLVPSTLCRHDSELCHGALMNGRHRRRPAARPSQLSRQTRCFVCAWRARHAVSVFNQGSIILGGSGLCRFYRYSSIAIWSDLHHHTLCLSGPDSGNVEEMHIDVPVSLSRGSHSPECRSHDCLCQGPFEMQVQQGPTSDC